jgi:hypothetical protein
LASLNSGQNELQQEIDCRDTLDPRRVNEHKILEIAGGKVNDLINATASTGSGILRFIVY